MNCQCNSSLVLDALLVVGTFLTIIVALFGEEFRKRWFGPKLFIRLIDNNGDLNKTNGKTDTIYYHLVAGNLKKTPAQNAVVLLSEIFEVIDDKKHIIWRGEVPMRWMYYEIYNRVSITLGSDSRCDFLAVNNDGIRLMTLFKPNNLEKCWNRPCNLLFTLFVKSDQAISNLITIQTIWDGEWFNSPEAMSKHLSIVAIKQCNQHSD